MRCEESSFDEEEIVWEQGLKFGLVQGRSRLSLSTELGSIASSHIANLVKVGESFKNNTCRSLQQKMYRCTFICQSSLEGPNHFLRV